MCCVFCVYLSAFLMCVRYFVYCVRRLYKGCRNGNTLFSTIRFRIMWWSHLKLWLIIHWLSVWGIGRLYVWQNYIGQSTEVHLICTFAPYWAKICRRSIWTIPSPRISCALSQQHTSVEIVIKPCRTFQVDLTTEDCLWYICTKLINNLYWINIKKISWWLCIQYVSRQRNQVAVAAAT